MEPSIWEDLTTYFRYVKSTKPGVGGWNESGDPSTFHADGYIQSKSDYVPLEGISSNLLFGVRRRDVQRSSSTIHRHGTPKSFPR